MGNVSDVERVSNEIEEEGYRKLNNDTPLENEEGVVTNVPLIAGYVDKNGVLHDTFSYREMDGTDEEALNKADVRVNGARMIYTLCERCVVAIGSIQKKEVGMVEWSKIIRNMLTGDLDYMALKIRALSIGNIITFQHQCPHCGKELITEVNVEELPIIPFKGMREIDFELTRGYTDLKGNVCKTGTIHLPTGADREAIVPFVRKNIATAYTVFLTRCAKFNEAGSITQSQIAKMTVKDRNYLQSILKDNAFGVDTAVNNLVCDSCGFSFDKEVGSSDFFS